MYRAKQKTGRSRPLVVTVVMLSLILAFLMVGTVYAKYIYATTGKNLLAAKEFYFTSNLLTEAGGSYKLNANTTSISFTLSNSFDELRISEVGITCTVNVAAQGADEPTVTFSDGKTLLTGNIKDQTTVTLSNLQKGGVYTVTAIGAGGYEQTLQATFSVSPNENYIHYHLDTHDPAYVLLTVWTGNVSGNLSVSVPAGLIPDNTDPKLRNIYNYQDGSYTAFQITDTESFAKVYSSLTYRFFRTDAELSDFLVTLKNNGTTYKAKEEKMVP